MAVSTTPTKGTALGAKLLCIESEGVCIKVGMKCNVEDQDEEGITAAVATREDRSGEEELYKSTKASKKGRAGRRETSFCIKVSGQFYNKTRLADARRALDGSRLDLACASSFWCQITKHAKHSTSAPGTNARLRVDIQSFLRVVNEEHRCVGNHPLCPQWRRWL